VDEFDFETARRRWPHHWDERGWPVRNSTWQATDYPPLRVRVATVGARAVTAIVQQWDRPLEELRRVLGDVIEVRWPVGEDVIIDPDEGEELAVEFPRAYFGGPDTGHSGSVGSREPFFEPVEDCG
jgi:hypothetical protein